MNLVSDIKLIRTDTTLDLSQKAEKGMLLPSIPPLLVPRLRPFLLPLTMGLLTPLAMSDSAYILVAEVKSGHD
jgi:hypothetical protein